MAKYAKVLIVLSILLILTGLTFLCGPTISTNKKETTASIRYFTLTATPNYSDINNPNIYLDWSSYGSGADTIFKGYQSKDEGNTWETISLMNYTSVRNVKVLNVYPEQGDGLKTWMESTTDSATGEVLGKGIISVDKINISAFNSSPGTYLKKTGSNWNYDVVVFGFWDRNNYYDISTSAKNLIDTYIQDGKGVIFGHDTGTNNSLGMTDTRVFNTDTAAQYKSGQDNFTYLTNKYLPMHWQQGLYVGSTEIVISKKGLLTQYPWDLGPVGTRYTIPSCHSWGQVLDDTSNVWMRFNIEESVAGSNFYIVSNNNVSMIQTGHTSGTSMEAEQKILANLMFYGYQLTSDTFVTDYSGMDLAEPTAPEISIGGDYNGININYSSTDNGSTYQYYIEGYTKPDMSVVTSKSNTVSTTITAGIKGYYYVIDNNATNDFNISSGTYTTNTNLSIPISNDGKYIHIKAVDNYDNISSVTNKKIEMTKYTTTLKLNGGKINNSTNDVIYSLYLNQSITLTDPTRTDYYFSGWTIPSTCSSTLVDKTFTAKDSCELNATWKDDKNNNGVPDDTDPKYTVKYSDGLNNTVFEEQSSTVLVGMPTPSFNGSTTRQNYIFAGWNPSVESTVTKDVTYTAIWKEDKNNNGTADEVETKYTITYKDGVDNSAFPEQVYENQLLGLNTPSFVGTPTRNNYVFDKWNPEVKSTIQGNAIYTAVWKEDFNNNGTADDTEEKYTVIYQDGLDNTVFPEEKYENLLIDTNTPAFTGSTTRQDYIFGGWSPSLLEKVDGNKTYTATWIEDKNNDEIPDEEQSRYTVKYIDGCNNEAFKDYIIDNILTGMNTPLFDGTPVREGYVFTGWDPEVEEKATKNTVYTATWEEDKNANGIPDKEDPKYKVTFKDGLNEIVFKDFTIEVLMGTKIPEFDTSFLQNDSYEFVEWSEPIDKPILEDKTIVAKWNIIIKVPDTNIFTNKRVIIISLIILLLDIIFMVYNLKNKNS